MHLCIYSNIVALFVLLQWILPLKWKVYTTMVHRSWQLAYMLQSCLILLNPHEDDEEVGRCMSRPRQCGGGFLAVVMCEGVNENSFITLNVLK